MKSHISPEGQELARLRAVEQELRDSEARFRALIGMSVDWYWEQDEHFRFTLIEGAAQLPQTVFPLERVIGRTRWEIDGTEPADGSSWDAHRALLARHEPFRNFEVIKRSADGTASIRSVSGDPIFDATGRFLGYRGVGRDVTERRRAQQELQESQRMLAALMGNLPGMAYRCRNEPDWPLEFVSEGAYELTGYRADMLGSAIAYGDLIHPEDRASVWNQVQSAVRRNQPFEITYRITDRGGEERWVWERGSAVRGPDGELAAVEGFISEVTLTRRAQDEVARLNAELEQRVQQRTAQLEAANADLESFAYSIAHDLRSPLTSIDGFSQSLETLCGPSLPDQGRHYLRRIRAGVRQMSDLTDAMLSLARLSRTELRWEPVDLAAAARQTIEMLRERQPHTQLDVELPARLWAHGDPRLLAQVMTNLVGNAWKFSAHQSRTEIRVGSMTGERGNTVYFVSDRGAGFDMAHAGRLFGAFQRLHAPSEFEGTGIGLALVQKIIHRHGGKIWAEAKPGEGATFYFTLAAEPVI